MKSRLPIKLCFILAALSAGASCEALAEPTIQESSTSMVAGASTGHALWLQPGAPSDLKPAGGESPRLRGPLGPFGSVTGHVVRVAYLIPSNRTAQTNAEASLRNAMIQYQRWYRDQMERNGFGAKTFRYETEGDGVTPKIYTVNVTETDDYLRGDLWGRTINAASVAGVPVWTAKQVWWLIPEAHLEMADGSVVGGTALGAGFGSGDDPGVAMVGSDALARYQPGLFTNDTAYHNQFMAGIGPYALKQDVSFPWFEGTTFSSVSSSVLGAALHEMTHGFGQPHDSRNDNNFNGNLMSNGLRGLRGALYPERYPADYTRAGFGSALALNVSRYFNAAGNFTDNVIPSLTITTSGTNTPVNGLLQISFNASDAGGLSAAWLIWKGDLVGEMTPGAGSAQTFATAYYDPGQTNQYTISVFDTQGNKRSVDAAIVPRTGFNRAPQPFIKVSPPTAFVGQDVVLDASQSSDPDHSSASLQVEWDLNSDGIYDTAPTTSKLMTNRFATAGNRLIRARLTDPAGAKTVSAPLAVRVETLTLAVAKIGNQVQLLWPATANGFALESTPVLASPNWQAVTQTPVIIGNQKVVTITNPIANAFFRLKKT